MNNDNEILELVKNNPCIPCEGCTKLKTPNQLVSPKGKVAQLFLLEEGLFPQAVDEKENRGTKTTNRVNFCDYTSLDRLSSLGMITDWMPWPLVLDRAKSTQQLMSDGRKEESLKRASRLILYFADNKDELEKCSAEVKDSLSHTKFLPVLNRPSDWPFPWAGDSPQNALRLAEPAELSSDHLKYLVACCCKLLHTKALELGGLLTDKPREVLKWLGVVVQEEYSNPTQMELAMRQLVMLSEFGESSDSIREQLQVSTRGIYAYLATCISRDHSDSESVKNDIRSYFSGRRVILVKNDFLMPSSVAFSCIYDCSPYLFAMENTLQSTRYRAFFQAVGIKDMFEENDVLLVLEKLKEENSGNTLNDHTIQCVKHLAQLLENIARRSPSSSLDKSRVFLPDQNGILRKAPELCVNDCTWLTGLTVHCSIPNDVALLLGVTTKKKQHFLGTKAIMPRAFGQKEKLTTRIRRLLDGYTFDSSLFMELLQNADDAGATEAKFIMDFRHLGKETVPDKWEALQGPALCFYNNRSFTEEDIQGIQMLGEGTKGDNVLQTGQFGVGFNAVFHVTDVPSFWTKVDDKKEKETVCIFDPNGRYVPETEPGAMGVEFPAELASHYPDMMSGYLGTAIDMDKPGTLFRFPLRNAQMVEISEIQKQVVSELKIKELLESFKVEMAECLLFVNNLQKVGIYNVQDNGTLQQLSEVNKSLDSSSSQKLDSFKQSLEQVSRMMRDGQVLENVPIREEIIQCRLADSTGHQDWLIVHRVGFAQAEEMPRELSDSWKDVLKLLPRGGVAVRLKAETSEQQQRHKDGHKLFCILPLPVNTKLPVHVNGHFALDHETRRNLWNSGKKDLRSQWNDAIATKIIVPAYVTALQSIRDSFFPSAADTESNAVDFLLKQFHGLFPSPGLAPSDFWKDLVHHLYRTLAKEETPVFPVLSQAARSFEWVPAVKKDGFPGYFDNLFAFYQKEKPSTSAPYRSAGTTYVHPSYASCGVTREPTSSENAKELKTLLQNLNMKVLETPFSVHGYFKDSGVDVQEVIPHTVLTFLRSADQNVNGGCNIRNLPQPVSETPLETSGNIEMLLKFVSSDNDSFLNSLNNLPLCLRESEVLHAFSTAEGRPKPILSSFCQLLPGSAEEFVYKGILNFFRICEQTDTVLQKLTIPMLAERLHLTLKDPCYSSARPCDLDLEKLPYRHFLRDLWVFFQEELNSEFRSMQEPATSSHEQRKISVGERRRIAAERLNCLDRWCLIPVELKALQQKKLYPMLDMHKVVFINVHESPNKKLQDILLKLPLPCLEDHLLLVNYLARDLVASINHPRALLHALASCSSQLTASHAEGCTILDYFNKNIETLRRSCQEGENLQQELRKLPVFPSVGGNLIALSENDQVVCIQDVVPGDGLMEWSRNREGLVDWTGNRANAVCLLRKKFVPDELLSLLGFSKADNGQFYAYYLLPTLQAMPRDAIFTHVKFLKSNFGWNDENADDLDATKRQLYQQLKRAAFVEVHGSLYTADQFYSPHVVVFRAMCPDKFPPELYVKDEWRSFMTAAGMISKVTPSMFLQFARSLETEGRNSELSKEIKHKSKTLVDHLYSRLHNAKQEELQLLRDLTSIRFVLPSDWQTNQKRQNEHTLLTAIAVPYCAPRLVSFSESSSETDLYLVWSTSCILHPEADPQRRKLHGVSPQDFDIPDQIPQTKVVHHLENVTKSLGGENGAAVFEKLSQDGHEVLEEVMQQLYGHFLKHNDSDNILKTLPLVCDIEKRQMLKAENVVIGLQDEDIIEGHIEKAPVRFGRYFSLFERLGTKSKVSANHYAAVLKHLKEKCQDEPLLPNEELKNAARAICGLFHCLEKKDEESRMISKGTAVYLLTDKQVLKRSTGMVFKDSKFGARFQGGCEDLDFFIGFKKLGIECTVPVDVLKRLPIEHSMKLLSDIVKEVIPDDILVNGTDGDLSRDLAERLAIAAKAIVRLKHAECYEAELTFTEEDAQLVHSKLVSNVEVKEVENLKTVLTLKGRMLGGSEKYKVSFTRKIREQDSTRRAVVYINADVKSQPTLPYMKLLQSLSIAIMFVIGLADLNEHKLYMVLSQPEEAMETLDQLDVMECDFSHIFDDSLFPKPGTFIPVRFHCYLDNGFYDFKENDYIGFEIFDPDIDGVNEGNGANEGNAETGNGESDCPVYIYAQIMTKVGNGEGFAQCYRIYMGFDRGFAEVNVTKLYKFVRKKRQSDSTDLVEHSQQPDSQEEQVPNDLRAVLREIRRTLTNAWQQLTDPNDRKRVVKRLLLRWHPDKNPGNEEFCTRVTQKILQYCDMLNEGCQLPDDDVDVVDGAHHRPTSTFYSSFYDHMSSRARSHRNYFDSDSSYTSADSRPPNPQPGEGRRWIRQATADVTAARAARGTSDKGRNWICYMCHQAAEKALKAVLYARDANSASQSHQLTNLSCWVEDPTLSSLASELENRVGPHVRMRYPDVLAYPNIPSDVYSDDDVCKACELASSIVDRSQALM